MHIHYEILWRIYSLVEHQGTRKDILTLANVNKQWYAVALNYYWQELYLNTSSSHLSSSTSLLQHLTGRARPSCKFIPRDAHVIKAILLHFDLGIQQSHLEPPRATIDHFHHIYQLLDHFSHVFKLTIHIEGDIEGVGPVAEATLCRILKKLPRLRHVAFTRMYSTQLITSNFKLPVLEQMGRMLKSQKLHTFHLGDLHYFRDFWTLESVVQAQPLLRVLHLPYTFTKDKKCVFRIIAQAHLKQLTWLSVVSNSHPQPLPDADDFNKAKPFIKELYASFMDLSAACPSLRHLQLLRAKNKNDFTRFTFTPTMLMTALFQCKELETLHVHQDWIRTHFPIKAAKMPSNLQCSAQSFTFIGDLVDTGLFKVLWPNLVSLRIQEPLNNLQILWNITQQAPQLAHLSLVLPKEGCSVQDVVSLLIQQHSSRLVTLELDTKVIKGGYKVEQFTPSLISLSERFPLASFHIKFRGMCKVYHGSALTNKESTCFKCNRFKPSMQKG